MLNNLGGISKILFVTAIVGSITFGAREAVAAKPVVCSPIPEECSTDNFCHKSCVKAGYQTGHCGPDNCCVCAT